MSYSGYLHGPLQMFGPENGVCNYLALEKINGMLILRIGAFSPPGGGGGGGGVGWVSTGTPGAPGAPFGYAPELRRGFA